MNPKEICEYVRTLSQALADKGEGVGLYGDWHDSELYTEFGNLTLEEITEDVTNIEGNSLRLITSDAIARYEINSEAFDLL
jgi:hypothetical protein